MKRGLHVCVYLGVLSSGWSSWHPTARISYPFLRRDRGHLLDQRGPLSASDYHQELKAQLAAANET